MARKTQPFKKGAPAFLARGFGKSKARAPAVGAVDKQFKKKGDARKRGVRPRFM